MTALVYSGLHTSLYRGYVHCTGILTGVPYPRVRKGLHRQLCSMLNFAHRQTTAYHPESNGAVERLHRRLRGWTSDLFSSQPRPELGGSPVETQYACLRVYLRTRGCGTPVSIHVHTPCINAYVIQNKLVLS
jgi:hypothetical protein